MVEEVVVDGVQVALILRSSFRAPGVRFFTPSTYSQQLGYMSHPAGHRIRAHVHRELRREVLRTQEVLLLRSGRVRVDFYGDADRPRASRVLEPGDVVLLARGGHGFEVLEACEMIEVKQGPYAGDEDKVLIGADAGKGV